MSDPLLQTISHPPTRSAGQVDFTGGWVRWEPGEVVVNVEATGRFKLTPSAPGSAELSRTDVSLQLELRSPARQRLRLRAEVENLRILNALPVTPTEGVEVKPDELMEVLRAVVSIGTRIAQLPNLDAPHHDPAIGPAASVNPAHPMPNAPPHVHPQAAQQPQPQKMVVLLTAIAVLVMGIVMFLVMLTSR